MLQAGRRLGGWTRMAGVLRIFPRPVRNWLYRRFARNRYALFGRAVSIGVEECPLIGVQKGV
ncbi:DCC1-like thiol-disulfide oxidoreductase family protein [Paracoccus versutus]|uniref:DCC1-like thiol-disulfide oxidoreductase family protein n=1 Tax=Paracoccus versutus TaxID=34007 RepID=UPI0030B8BC61